jgi:hypothetical protein
MLVPVVKDLLRISTFEKGDAVEVPRIPGPVIDAKALPFPGEI